MKQRIFVLLVATVFALCGCGEVDIHPNEERSPDKSKQGISQMDESNDVSTTDATDPATDRVTVPDSESEPNDLEYEKYVKIFPNIKPEWKVRIVYENGSTIKLTEEDIDVFQYYAEAYTAIWCNNAAPDYDTSELPFLRTRSIEEIISSNNSRGDSTVVNSCQLLAVFVNPDDTIDLIILSEIEGYLDKFKSTDVYTNLSCTKVGKDESGWYIYESGVLQVDPKGIWDVAFDEDKQKIVVTLIEN